MVIQTCNFVIVWSTMKNFPYLLQKAFPIKLSSAYKGIFSKKNMFTSESGVKTKNIKEIAVKCAKLTSQ